MSGQTFAQKAKGQYFTPPEVARLVWEILIEWAKPAGSVRVCDPAAGEGVFLETAAEALGTNTAMTGMDLDAKLHRTWASLQKLHPNFSFHCSNGLCDLPSAGFEEERYDFVAGNPPFGGEGLRNTIALDRGLLESVLRLESWRLPAADYGRLLEEFHNQTSGGQRTELMKAIKRLRHYSIEALFFERFVRLAKPGGWIAVILPEGLLANDRHRRVRQWIAEHAHLRGVINLPRRTFSQAKTSAHTSLVILQRKGRKTCGRPILFANPGYSASNPSFETYANEVAGAARGEGKQCSCFRFLEVETVGERRWHSGFFDPNLKLPDKSSMRFPVRPLGDFIEFMTYGPIITGERVREVGRGRVKVIGQKAILQTGIDVQRADRVPSGSRFDPPRSRPQSGDLLMPRSGNGSLAKNKLAVFTGGCRANVGCFVDIVRLRGINPFYVWMFLKTDYGFDQIRRLFNGVGTVNLSFDEIRSLRIPEAPAVLQTKMEERYRLDVLPLHEKQCRSNSRTRAESLGAQAKLKLSTIVEDLQKIL